MDLQVYAIWVPILPTDDRSQWDAELLNEPRVTHLWDEERVAGEWFADPDNLGLDYPGQIMWDAFLLFGREARWDDAPSPLLASGWTVIGNIEKLETAFDAHLAEASTPTPGTATPGPATPRAVGVVTSVSVGLMDPRGVTVAPDGDHATALAS